MDIVIVDPIHTNMVQRILTTITNAMMMTTQEKTHMLSKHQAITSFPLLLRRMDVFIFVLIHF